MYTGITQGCFQIVKVEDKGKVRKIRLKLNPKMLEGLEIGASVSVDGVCLTVIKMNNDSNEVDFDIAEITLKTTTLAQVKEGEMVNVERSYKEGSEIGGHIVYGHVFAAVKIVAIQTTGDDNRTITFEVPKDLMKYIFPKGFIALNGASITIQEVDKELGRFSICLIPLTLKITTFAEKKIGDRVNLEIENKTQVSVDTIERIVKDTFGETIKKIFKEVLEEKEAHGKISVEKVKETDTILKSM